MRLLLSTFGSAGDLFPLMAVSQELRRREHTIVWAVPRSLGLYLRAQGERSIALGDGREIAFSRDERLFTTARDGFTSTLLTLNEYVIPHVVSDAETIESALGSDVPDAVVSMDLAVSARYFAMSRDLPFVLLSVCPPFHDESFAAARTEASDSWRSQLGKLASPFQIEALMWGTDAQRVVLRDPALVSTSTKGATGYPYWDQSLSSTTDIAAADRWVATESTVPSVLCCLGSFAGLHGNSPWKELGARLANSSDARMLFVGPGSHAGGSADGAGNQPLAVGYVPLSRLVRDVDLVVHHGGLGTTMAALGAAKPSVVLPIAFDQQYNARVVESVGAGFEATFGTVSELVSESLGALASTERGRVDLAGRLISSHDAAALAADQIEAICR